MTKWHALWVPACLAALTCALVLLYLLVHRIDYLHPGLLRPEIIDFVDLNKEANLPTWFSALLWQLAAFLAFSVAQMHRENGLPNVCYWIGMVPLFLFLSLDESATIHEIIGATVYRHIELPKIIEYTYAWVFVGIGIVVVVGALYFRFLLRLRPIIAFLFVVSAAMFVVGAAGVESIGAALEQGQFERFPLGLNWAEMIMLEEAMEMLGVILLVHTLLRVLALGSSPYTRRHSSAVLLE